jgi:hypothetical protein
LCEGIFAESDLVLQAQMPLGHLPIGRKMGEAIGARGNADDDGGDGDPWNLIKGRI